VYKQEDPKGESSCPSDRRNVLTLSPAALSALGKAIQLLVGDGKIRQAADRTKDQAGIYKDMGEPLLAAGAFEEAGNLYDQEDAKA
jgi:hypothetical protein